MAAQRVTGRHYCVIWYRNTVRPTQKFFKVFIFIFFTVDQDQHSES